MDMATKSASRVQENAKASTFTAIGRQMYSNSTVVCKYWLAGRCNRNPCNFLHTDSDPLQPIKSTVLTQNQFRRPSGASNEDRFHCNKPRLTWTKPKYSDSHRKISKDESAPPAKGNVQKNQQTLCKYWVNDNCVHGQNCKDLHSWFSGNGFFLLAKLEGHKKTVTSITLPPGSQNLLSTSGDNTVRVWNCNTGQCTSIVNVDCEKGTLINEGAFLFLGLRNAVKVWNINNNQEITLAGPVGLVYSMVVGNDMLFAGAENGTVFCWKFQNETNNWEPFTSLKGHKGAVLSLTVGANKLFSGAIDSTIRVWDLDSLKCKHTLIGHNKSVTSLLCWDNYLLSGSLDGTIKVWAASETGKLEVVYQHNDGHAVIAFCGLHDAEAKPILLCSLKDNTVRLYDLPSFIERGRIFSKREVQSIEIGPDGLFFTGDGTGLISVWKLNGEAKLETGDADDCMMS